MERQTGMQLQKPRGQTHQSDGETMQLSSAGLNGELYPLRLHLHQPHIIIHIHLHFLVSSVKD